MTDYEVKQYARTHQVNPIKSCNEKDIGEYSLHPGSCPGPAGGEGEREKGRGVLSAEASVDPVHS
ncbi:hypothetical protein NQZ68_013761 [Dissostichus eleginoides]|nr:hypothetical protein NQZ68_013761 [Dissostichus eleginoides]